MEKVIHIMDLLEQNGFTCFASFRNLRHGKGAQEDYLSFLQLAMKACGCFLFLSSESSRSMECDAMRVELPYLVNELEGKPRLEYLLEDYQDTPFLAKRTLKKAFPSQEQCRDEEDLLLRLEKLLSQTSKNEKNEAGSAQKRVSESSSDQRIQEEAEAKVRAQRFAKAFKEPILDGGYLYYGEYPQRKVNDPAILQKLQDAALKPTYGLFLTINGEKFAKYDGQWFYVTPIAWEILHKEGKECLVVSRDLIDARRYDPNDSGYLKSEIRKWLHEHFFPHAFPHPDFVWTASSGEATLLCFRGLDNVRTFGVPTAGYASANVPYTLTDGYRLVITTSCDKARTGEVFCDDPIEPDVETDTPLEDAVSWIATSQR